MLVGLMQLHVWSCMLTESPKDGLCIISVTYLSVMCVHLSCSTQSHMMHSAMCYIDWFCQDNPTRRPVRVPGIVDQPNFPLV